jgi:hypothetical protein
MPGKVKTRKANDSADDLWVAPRRTSYKPPRVYEPVSGNRLNRYLEFADIALGLNQPGTRKKKATKTASKPAAKTVNKPGGEKPGPKLLLSNTNAKRGFGAFRSSR